jgi:hypothetical protein
MPIIIIPTSRFVFENKTEHFKYLIKLNPSVFYQHFVANSRLILSEECVAIVNNMHSKIKVKILKIDGQRKENELRKQQFFKN